jgi:hypothetical protein
MPEPRATVASRGNFFKIVDQKRWLLNHNRVPSRFVNTRVMGS